MISHEEAVMQDREIQIRELVKYAEENADEGYLTLNGTGFELIDKVIKEVGYVSYKFMTNHGWGCDLEIPTTNGKILEISLVPDDVIVFTLDDSKNSIYYDADLTLYQLFDDFCEKDGVTPVGPVDLKARITELVELCECIVINYSVGIDNFLNSNDTK